MLSHRPRVLIIDNVADNIRRLQESLGDEFDISRASSAEEATSIADEQRPDLILLNTTPSGGDGYAWCSTLKSGLHGKRTPKVLYASSAEAGDEGRALAVGAVECLIDPFESPLLPARLRNLIAQSQFPLASAVFQQVREGIMVTDLDDRIIDVNPAFCQLTGYSRDEVVGKTPAFLKSGRHDDTFYAKLWEQLTQTGHWSGEVWNRMKNGELHPQLLTVTQVKDATGQPSHYIGVWSDIRIIKDHQRKLERLAYYDPLTDLPNRSLLEDRIHQAIAYTLRAGGLLGIGFLDIDGYRAVTERLGHQTGDQVLLEVAKRLTDLLRAGDTVARVGGDEFVFLLIGVENTEECESITGRIIKLLAEPIRLPQGEVKITASVGLTFAPTDCINPDTLIRHADEAMVAVKTAGKNGFRVYQPSDESVGC